MDTIRINRMKRFMKESGFDALVVRLPENVLYLSGYWPIIGASLLLFPLEGEPVLFAPEDENPYIAQGWVKDVRRYKYFNVNALSNPNRDISVLLKKAVAEKKLEKAVIGYEGSFELTACNHVRAETRVATVSSLNMLQEILPVAKLVDATKAIVRSRACKSPEEIRLLKVACEITAFGYQAAKEMIKPGLKETEVAMAVEAGAHIQGVGYQGTTRAQAFAFVMGGENSVSAWRPFVISSDYVLKNGDVALLEVDAYADGYFIDLTRTYAVGTPTDQQLRIYEKVVEAQETALAAIKPGVRAADIDVIAQQVLRDAGLLQYRKHHLGHGVGLQFHDPVPTLLPVSEDVLEEGMTFAVEPAVYVPGVGGLRVEDNVVVTKDGFEYLSVLSKSLI